MSSNLSLSGDFITLAFLTPFGRLNRICIGNRFAAIARLWWEDSACSTWIR
jgi:hypothetical protein